MAAQEVGDRRREAEHVTAGQILEYAEPHILNSYGTGTVRSFLEE